MKIILSIIATSVVLLFSTSQAYGQVNLSIDDILLMPSENPQFGSFEINISHELASDPSLAGFQLVLELFNISPAAAGRFVDVQPPVDSTYAFDPFSSAPIGVVAAVGNVVQIGDFLLSGSATLNDDLALARVNFEIPGGSLPGDEYRVDFSISPDDTFLATGPVGRVPFTVDGASIRVVPEPGSAIPLAVLLSLASLKARRKRIAG